jgi:hypothetical protein
MEVRSYLLLIGEKMTKRSKLITLARLTSGLLVLVVSLSGCSTIKQATSEAYNLGYQTGQEFTQLEDFGTLLESYVPEVGDTPLSSFSEDSVRDYCDGLWMIAGFNAGIVNSAENKEQFVSGCADGYKSKL